MIAPVPFSVDGVAMEIEAMTAAQAYEIAASGDWMRLFPGAVEEDGYDWINERFNDTRDPLTVRSMWRIAHALARRVYGVEWWSAVRLAMVREAGWLSFEAWSIKQGFDADAPWVSPRRLTAGLMAWLASTCEKEVEWQQLQVQIQSPPEYAVHLPDEEDENGTPAGAVDASAFQSHAPHWAVKAEQNSEPADPEAAESPTETAPPWTAQPVLSMEQFAAQAQQWAQAKRAPAAESVEVVSGEAPS